MKICVDLSIDEDLWTHIKSEDEWIQYFEIIAYKALIKFDNNFQDLKKCFISITMTNDNEIRDINKRFRNIDRGTNVLSFPQYDANEIQNFLKEKGDEKLLGDIVLSYDTIKRESDLFHKEFLDRVAHLFVHAVLHLCGMDHIDNDDDRERMEDLETKILKDFGIDDPYVFCDDEEI